ncbi:MAG TPA: hypothetical protein VFY80_04645, partial [Burkholderiales bacterium]|nr:hypothetical protein [Burkholderiales bacterium]
MSFVASGNGTAAPTLVTTDARGVATLTSWTLPTQAGSHQLTVSTAGVAPLVIEATAQPGPPAHLAIVTQPHTFNGTGQQLATQPVVEIQDQFGNRADNASGSITAVMAPGSLQTLSGTTTVMAVAGRAVFTDLAVSGIGSARLLFVSGTLTPVTSAAFNVPASTLCPSTPAVLDLGPGEIRRWQMSAGDAPTCLDFPQAMVSGREYLLQFENISLRGNSDTGLFPGVTTGLTFTVWVDATGTPSGNLAAPRALATPAGAVHAWDFGAGPIYEAEPPEPPGGVPPVVSTRGRLRLDANLASAAAAVGDTISVFMAGIPRLGIADGVQQAIVRYVGPNLIIAEDVRLGTLTRQDGTTNTPLLLADMEAIAADYAQYARVQGDLFFQNRHNSATEAAQSRIIAVHSLMYADNIWGYTYPSQNYFVWDYWVGTNGSTKGVNQSIVRNANNLFMHEIAHMRHYGMSERAGRTAARGNRWLVEGFARATERWPITMRLTGVTEFSRTGNIQLPLFSPTSLSSLEDVPVYLAASFSVLEGYGSSSYIFDYFADQVALTGADWRVALGEFLVNAGVEADLNSVIARYLPGVDVATLFTRARAALFLDDY